MYDYSSEVHAPWYDSRDKIKKIVIEDGATDIGVFAFDGEKIASFCVLEDIGVIDGMRIGAPGCVGTVPEYRRRGIGLEMVRRATETLRREGYDISWIHFTHLAGWYSKLGYSTVLRWNRGGFLPEE